MNLGFALPQFGSLAHQANRVAEFAVEAERAGAASLWVGDRLIAPTNPSVGYGGGPGIPREFRSRLDPFTVLAAAAAVTSTPSLGTNVLNLPWYPPAMVARSLSTVDLISEGRLIPGFGIGWSPEEYEAMNVPFDRRGARLDESLDALEALWGNDPAEHRGTFWSVPRTHVELSTAQRPRPPVYLGGFGEPALRRVGRRADGWLPAGVVGHSFSARRFEKAREVVDVAAGDAGRSPGDVHTILRVNVPAGTRVGQIVEELGAVLAGTGITDAFVDLCYVATDVDAALTLAADLLRQT